MKNERPQIGETVNWTSRIGKVKYTAIVKVVRVRDRIAKIVRDNTPTTMPFEYFWVDFDEIGYAIYPIAFRTKSNAIIYKSVDEVSADGTPRYVCNPNSPSNTYSLSDCLKDWEPIYTKKRIK